MDQLINDIKKTEHGFKHIVIAGDIIIADKTLKHFELATKYLSDQSYQVRMLATYLLGQLATHHLNALKILETQVMMDKNWRVQEMLAKALDHYCKIIGYKKALPVIEKWLSDTNPNLRRAVIEGLRIWTSRPYFKENPEVAIHLIARSKLEESAYLRKAVGNALRDIRKKHKHLVDTEVSGWDLKNKKVLFIYTLINK